MKIYLVSSGEYSDYGIHHVSSTREKAEEWIGTGGEEYNIEEWELDDSRDQVVTIYEAAIWLNTGEEAPGYCRSRPYPYVKPAGFRGEAKVCGSGFAIAESSMSREHALKIAVEKRQEWLRTRDLVAKAP